MWTGVIMLENHRTTLTSQLRDKLWSQNFINITSGGQITVNYQPMGTKIVVDGAPDHYATATKPVTFHNAVVTISLSVTSINTNPTVIMVQPELRLIAEDDVMPADTLFMVLNKINAKQSVTFCEDWSMIWASASYTKFFKSP